ncbi:hypothetical protein ACFY9C_00005 [Streptomyces filamentosus]|uniref:hypothetical protein n=1 Tax=Streptomyces filamentosus TaxID=67294 RepID=UPI0036E4B57D
MTDVTGPQVRLRLNDFVPDPDDPDVLRRVIDVQADVMTFENGIVTLWLQGTEVGSFPVDSLKEAKLTGSVQSVPAQAAPRPDTRAYTVAQVRAQHGNAYQRWTETDDQRLLELHAAGHDAESLARAFSRQPSAIHARLSKLGVPGVKSEPQPQPLIPPF